jgi:hypothetical protein
MKLAPYICTALLFISPLSFAASSAMKSENNQFKISMNIFFDDKISSKSMFFMRDKEDTKIHVNDEKKIHDLSIQFSIKNHVSQQDYIDVNTDYKYRCGDKFYTIKSYELYSPQNEAKVTLSCTTGESYTISTLIERVH